MAKAPAKTQPAAEAAGEPDAAPEAAPAMTAEQAAAAVKRTVVYSEAGATRTVFKPVAPEEVLAFRDYGTHVVVVTVDGQKFSSAAAQD